ncbi:hypothetical protein DL98DRAFT_576852 [Cadophora sp. DSE1049]|nr:hypothetical protein DL98DRAFT_576852 [Cadophora sp. DSE1049]
MAKAWEQAELSVGQRCGSLDGLGRYNVWSLRDRSPAHDLWRKISKPIVSLLEDNYEHLDVEDSDLMIEMYMIGRKASSTTPAILIAAERKLARVRAIQLISRSSILPEHPRVRLAHSARLPEQYDTKGSDLHQEPREQAGSGQLGPVLEQLEIRINTSEGPKPSATPAQNTEQDFGKDNNEESWGPLDTYRPNHSLSSSASSSASDSSSGSDGVSALDDLRTETGATTFSKSSNKQGRQGQFQDDDIVFHPIFDMSNIAEDPDDDAQSCNTDNRSHDAPPDTAQLLVSSFAANNYVQIAESFSNLSHARYNTQEGIGMKSKLNETPLAFGDKVSAWSLDNTEAPTTEANVDWLGVEEEGQDELPYAESLDFLTTSTEYQYLLATIQTTLLLTPKDGEVCGEISSKILSSLGGRQGQGAGGASSKIMRRATFELMWDPVEFLLSQNYEKGESQKLEEVITITGSTPNAQAMTCGDYMKQTWPVTGSHILVAIQSAINATISKTYEGRSGIRTYSTYYRRMRSKRISRHPRRTTCLGLGAACRQSPTQLIERIVPILSVAQNPMGQQPIFKFAFNISSMKIDDTANGSCWHNMFRNPVIVEGFPIATRSASQIGLEVSLGMMAQLGEASFMTEHEGGFVIKGFSTMFVLMSASNGSILWHFLFEKSGSRLPYAASSRYDRCLIRDIDARLMERGRHFVGWTSKASFWAGKYTTIKSIRDTCSYSETIGTLEAKHAKIGHSELECATSGMAVDKATIGGGKFITLSFGIVKGNKDTPVFSSRVSSLGYERSIIFASRTIHVVLHDTEERRAWLLDGASALLHLSLTKLANEPFSESPLLKREALIYADPFSDPRRASIAALTSAQNMALVIGEEIKTQVVETTTSIDPNELPKTVNKSVKHQWCFKNLVEETWYQLEKIHENQIKIKNASGLDIRTTAHTELEGFAYMDVIEYTDPLRPRVITLKSGGKGWIDFTRAIGAITLFGKGFGNLISPAPTSNMLCKRWKNLPTGEDNMAVYISTLDEMCRRNGNSTGSRLRLAPDIYWHKDGALFEPCSCPDSSSCDRVQVLYSKVLLEKWFPKEKDSLFTEQGGAIIIGRTKSNKIHWPRPGNPASRSDAGNMGEERFPITESNQLGVKAFHGVSSTTDGASDTMSMGIGSDTTATSVTAAPRLETSAKSSIPLKIVMSPTASGQETQEVGVEAMQETRNQAGGKHFSWKKKMTTMWDNMKIWTRQS